MAKVLFRSIFILLFSFFYLTIILLINDSEIFGIVLGYSTI